MCKKKTEGFRCAADTRRDVAATRAALAQAQASGDPQAMQIAYGAWKDALCEHAATPMGLKEVLDRVDALYEAGLPDRAEWWAGIANTGEFIRDTRANVHQQMLQSAAAEAAQRGECLVVGGVSREGLSAFQWPFYLTQSAQWDGQMSGWKAHITTFSTDEAFDAWTRIADVVEAHGLAVKFAGPRVHQSWGLSDQQGKGLTVYFPHRDTVEEDLYAVINAMDGWHHEDPPNGDAKVAPGIGVRWEFGDVDYGRDLPQQEYEQMYVSARGEFSAPESATALLGGLAPSRAPAQV